MSAADEKPSSRNFSWNCLNAHSWNFEGFEDGLRGMDWERETAAGGLGGGQLDATFAACSH